MDLTHTFTVPTSVDETWAHFQDIGALAECFPGAQVNSVGETVEGAPTFEGTCKVKLGPIALVYAGSGLFVERDEGAHRFVVEAKGRDKRGNGTAGATVTVGMQAAGDETTVEVLTDLSITGKPAQFGRGVMQDVSDKLLGQFVACLEQRLAAEDPGGPGDTGDLGGPGDTGDEDQEAGPPSQSTGAAAVELDPERDQGAGPASPPAEDDALDLGAALIPVLVRSYGRKIAAALAVLVLVALVVRRLRR
jgi:carbon monoxide dehydrogenase subunit G